MKFGKASRALLLNTSHSLHHARGFSVACSFRFSRWNFFIKNFHIFSSFKSGSPWNFPEVDGVKILCYKLILKPTFDLKFTIASRWNNSINVWTSKKLKTLHLPLCVCQCPIEKLTGPGSIIVALDGNLRAIRIEIENTAALLGDTIRSCNYKCSDTRPHLAGRQSRWSGGPARAEAPQLRPPRLQLPQPRQRCPECWLLCLHNKRGASSSHEEVPLSQTSEGRPPPQATANGGTSRLLRRLLRSSRTELSRRRPADHRLTAS